MEQRITPPRPQSRPIRIVPEVDAIDPRDEKLRLLDAAMAAFLAEIEGDDEPSLAGAA